jgi:hypothetical protein
MATTKKRPSARAKMRFMDLPLRKNPRAGSLGWAIKIDEGVLKLNPQPLPP